jgi:GT2 family glycosyltransferase
MDEIWYSNPYSITKNFGGAINKFCEIVPNDNDWIVIQDGDILYLNHDWGKVIHDTLQANTEYDLLGCFTNRLRLPNQLHLGQFNNDHDIRNHFEISKLYSGTEIIPTKNIAGLFMAFRKSTWKLVNGFKENTHSFDTDFCMRLRLRGKKIGLMKGLYVYHSYRIWSQSPTEDIKHLLK